MKAFLLVLAISSTLSSALPRQRRSIPCPYHVEDSPIESLLQDEYIVELNPGYNLKDHYDFIGFNLSARAERFNFKNRLNMYGVKIDKATMHNIIRYDPGVYQVSHNRVLHHKEPWNGRHDLNETGAAHELQKRWSYHSGVRHYSTGHINEWEKKPENWMKEWYHTESMYQAGKATDVYILDTGLDVAHECWRRFGNARYLKDGKHYTDEENVGGVVSANAPFATVVGVKVLGKGSNEDRLVEAINDILDDHETFKEDSPDEYKGAVINMSFGLEKGRFRGIESAIRTVIAFGIPVVTSAGNDGDPQGTPPCGYRDVICVGAIAKDYRKTQYSNYGKHVTIYAPGHHIYVPDSSRYDRYHYMDGTSFASPMVASMLATYIGYEGINNNVSKVVERMKQNWHEGVLDSAIPNILVSSGVSHPDKNPDCPYNGVEVCDEKAPTKEIDTGFNVDMPEQPSEFMEEPSLAPPEPAECPEGCTCGSSGPPVCPFTPPEPAPCPAGCTCGSSGIPACS